VALPQVPTAIVSAVFINVMLSPKYEPERQQTRRPCGHQSQQEPLIVFHCSAPPICKIFPINLPFTGAVSLRHIHNQLAWSRLCDRFPLIPNIQERPYKTAV
jgi:hypothetical protein